MHNVCCTDRHRSGVAQVRLCSSQVDEKVCAECARDSGGGQTGRAE